MRAALIATPNVQTPNVQTPNVRQSLFVYGMENKNIYIH